MAGQGGPATLIASATATSHHLMESARRLLTYSRRHTGRTGVQSALHGLQERHSDAGLANATGPLHAIPFSGNSSACVAGAGNAPKSMGLVAAADDPSAAVYAGMADHGEAPHHAVLPSVPSAASLARKLLALRIPGASAQQHGMQGGQEGVCRRAAGNEGRSTDAAGTQAPQRYRATAAARTGSAAEGASPTDGRANCLGPAVRNAVPSSHSGVFQGMVAMVDPAIPMPEADRSDTVLCDGNARVHQCSIALWSA